MDLDQLRYFRAVVRTGSLTRAARELGMSQPSLTLSIRNLETSLGSTLLVRTRAGVTPTSTGEVLLRHAEELLHRVEEARREVTQLQDAHAGAFTLGCHESLAAYFLPAFMRKFMADTPRVDLGIWNGTSAAVRDAVVRREVDLGLCVNAEPHPDLVMVPLFHDAVDVLAPRDVVERTGGDADSAAEVLRSGTLVLAPRVAQCQVLLESLRQRGMTPARVLRCGDLELVKSLALGGVGSALLPRRVAAYNAEGRLLRLHPGLPFFPDVISLLYRGDIHRTAGAMVVKDALVAFGRTLDEGPDPTAAPFAAAR